MKAGTSNLGAYGGQVSGEAILDATSGAPSIAMHCDLVGVRALPLLQGLADFDRLDGKLQAKIAVRTAGGSQHALMSGMQGTVFANFQDGAIRASYTSATKGLAAGGIYALRLDTSGSLWVAAEGGVSRIQNGRISPLSRANGLPCEAAQWTMDDDSGALWFSDNWPIPARSTSASRMVICHRARPFCTLWKWVPLCRPAARHRADFRE